MLISKLFCRLAKCDGLVQAALKSGRSLLQEPRNPVRLVYDALRSELESFAHLNGIKCFEFRPPASPVVSVNSAFDRLLVPSDHSLRNTSDTFYVTERHGDTSVECDGSVNMADKPTGLVLRPHATAHQADALSALTAEASGSDPGLVYWGCDVYRRDSVDATHYPIFHQMDVLLFDKPDKGIDLLNSAISNVINRISKRSKSKVSFSWIHDAYFPFTDPSWELELTRTDGHESLSRVEVLGCGVMRPEIKFAKPNNDCTTLSSASPRPFAAGIGLERIAMVAFGIPDLRYVWSKDERLLRQFTSLDDFESFKEFPTWPNRVRDVSFWLPEPEGISDQVEDAESKLPLLSTHLVSLSIPFLQSISLVDSFHQGGKTSLCIRLEYNRLEHPLENRELDRAHDEAIRGILSLLPCATIR